MRGTAAHAGTLLTATAVSNKLFFVSTPEPRVLCQHPGNDEVHLLGWEEGKISDHAQFLLSSLYLMTCLSTNQISGRNHYYPHFMQMRVLVHSGTPIFHTFLLKAVSTTSYFFFYGGAYIMIYA